MIASIHSALQQDYYDPKYHGVDVDARYKFYEKRIANSRTLEEVIQAAKEYLMELDDSGTYVMPMWSGMVFSNDYGYRMQFFGDNCYVTEVRPGSDAAQKLHPGDQVLLRKSSRVDRNELCHPKYHRTGYSPELPTELTLRDPTGNVRKELVGSESHRRVRRKLLKQLKALKLHEDEHDLFRDAEEQDHVLRQRHVERGDVMIWKMPVFESHRGEINQLMDQARKHKALILDLRGNPGGREQELVSVVGRLFDHEVKIATWITRKGARPLVAKSIRGGIFTGKLLVLMDSRSASMAELLARVIQLEHRGMVIGDQSSGRVMGTHHYNFLMDGDWDFVSVSVTNADPIVADGKSLEQVGVTPDVLILPTAADLAAGRDPALSRAAELAGLDLDPEAAGKLFPFEWSTM